MLFRSNVLGRRNSRSKKDHTRECRGLSRTFERLESRLCLSGATIEGMVWNDFNDNSLRDQSIVAGSEPDVVLVVDVSESTRAAQFGFVGQSGWVWATSNPDWTSVNLSNDYINPVVVVSSATYEDSDPIAVRVEWDEPVGGKVDGFSFKLEEWTSAQAAHGSERLNYVVMESGVHTLDDGTLIEVGTLEVGTSWVEHEFSQNFYSTPVVFTQVMSNNESTTVVTRQHWDGNDSEIHMITVPEPSGVVLLLIMGLSCLGAWRAAMFLS